MKCPHCGQDIDEEYIANRPGTEEIGAAAGPSLEEALAELDSLQGLASVKASIARLCDCIRARKLADDTEIFTRHFLFFGNPGTGKTRMAFILAKILHAVGALPTEKVVPVDRSMLVGPYIGQTAPLVNRYVDEALGGVLYIDDAPYLEQGPSDMFGREALDTLVKRLVEDLGKFVVILSGYPKNMDAFIAEHPGFRARFPEHYVFEDYEPSALLAAFTALAKEKNLSLAEGFEEAVAERITRRYEDPARGFRNNMRDIHRWFMDCEENKAKRVMALRISGASEEESQRESLIFQAEDLRGID
jgi:SpoVK/Ycf46/Vps4 family AAA+-type ATPase